MAEEEVDYMSDDFLSQCVGNNDIRPGLIHNPATKRKHELEKKRQNDEGTKKMKPIKEQQMDRLKEGMSTAIDPSNRGFALLQKMGYKPGMSLGKEGQGRIEPITVEVKSDRVGLGWQQLIAEKRKEKELLRKERLKQRTDIMDVGKYRARMSSEHLYRLIESDLRKSQKACYNLDTDEGITAAHEYWFWPSYTWKNDENEDDNDSIIEESNLEESEDEFDPAEQLEVLTSYLRTTYFYCIWCCQSYENEADFEIECPGPTRSDHD